MLDNTSTTQFHKQIYDKVLLTDNNAIVNIFLNYMLF